MINIDVYLVHLLYYWPMEVLKIHGYLFIYILTGYR